MSPLLAVCGLCGGAGTTTVSYLVARFAVRHGPGHVLVCDTGGPGAGLAECAGLRSPRSLREIASNIAHRRPLTGGIYAVDESAATAGHELRVIATEPRIEEDEAADGIEGLLAMARSDGAHALTVVDCGALQTEAEQFVLGSASHVAWVLPATGAGVRRAEQLLPAVGPLVAGRELVVARNGKPERPEIGALRVLAERRRAPLVLVPHLDDPLDRPGRALEEAQVALQALLGALAR